MNEAFRSRSLVSPKTTLVCSGTGNSLGDKSNLSQTRAMLMRACDVRLPPRLRKNDLDFIATALVKTAEDVKRAGAALEAAE